MQNQPKPGILIRDLLRHDLNFRTGTFVPSIEYRPKSLWKDEEGINGVSWEDLPEHWNGMEFNNILEEVIEEVRNRLYGQFNHTEKFEVYLRKFIDVFPYVEYIVNARLLHAFCRMHPSNLHGLISKLFDEPLPGDGLVLFRGNANRRGAGNRQHYHVAQDDGLLINDEILASVEIKTNGKSNHTKFDAAQYVKHAWLLSTFNNPKYALANLRLLVILPYKNEKYGCLSTDITLNGRVISLADRRNVNFYKFLNKINYDEHTANDLVANIHAVVCSYDDLLEGGFNILEGNRVLLDALELVKKYSTK